MHDSLPQRGFNFDVQSIETGLSRYILKQIHQILLDTMVVTSRVWSSVVFCMWLTASFSQISLCRGSCQRYGHEVYCDLYTQDDNDIADFYHHNISHLYLTLDGDFAFDPDLLPLNHIHGLKELVVDGSAALQTSYFIIDYNATKSAQTLALLESLRIHIPLRKIDPTVFKHMERLKYLSLSHTLGLTASDIRHVLQNLSHAGDSLEELDLSWSRCFPHIQPDLLNIREDILRNLATFPLKFLDLRGIEFIEVDIGFAEFTPGLEKLRAVSYTMACSGRNRCTC